MQLFLESNLDAEIRQAAESALFHGLFAPLRSMPLQGQTVDTIAQLYAPLFHELHVEVTGSKSHEMVHEAHRLVHAGLVSERTLFRLPVSFEGLKACRELEKADLHVHIEWVGNLQQAWMAMEAGARMISIPVHQLQEQGMDPLATAADAVSAGERYGYPCRIMLTGVQHSEHVREALRLGVHAVAMGWNVSQQLPESPWSHRGAREMQQNARLMGLKVRDVMRRNSPVVQTSESILDAVVQMSKGGMGAVVLLHADGSIAGMFTDGDLRRQLESKGKDLLSLRLSELPLKTPISLDVETPLFEAAQVFRERRIDNILITEQGRLAGMLDIQDLNA